MNYLSKSWFRLSAMFVGITICAMGAAQLHAQQNAVGMITGTVLDPVGSIVQNANVTARNEATHAETKTTSDQAGKFVISNLPMGYYTVEVSVPGFALASHAGVHASSDRTEDLMFTLTLGSVNDAITVEANSSGSIAAQHAPMDGLLEARSARTEVTPIFIQNYTSPIADFGELVEMAPGTFSISTDGIGLGQDKTFFRGFADGNYDIDYDGVPFYDTNDPTHHTWAFFPDPWVGSVDFDRSPGSASDIGPTPFGGSIHLLSPQMDTSPVFRGTFSYGSFNTVLLDTSYDSGLFAGRKANLFADVQRMTSDGFETFNRQTRDAGSLKFQYKFSDNNVLTGFAGVVWLDSNTPNNNALRGQINALGYNYLNSNDFNAAELTSPACVQATFSFAGCQYPLNYQFYTYHVPTDFEYADWSKQWGHGWQTDFKPYTLSYYNAQYYNNPKYNSDGSFKGSPVSATSAVDKLNSYRKYGENVVASQVSKFGIFRVGLWYEFAGTNRYQIASNPLTRVDVALPNFHETFHTNSFQPYIEYEYRVTSKLTVTAGFKYAYFNQNLIQYADASKVGNCLGGTLNSMGVCVGGGLASVQHSAGYSSYLPSVDANYHLLSNWSIYGQFGEGTKVPPSAVFDVTGANVVATPKPTGVKTYQGGTVLKLKQVTLSADGYYIRYQGAFTSIPDNSNQTGFDYVASGDTVSKGFEGEVNVYLTHGFSFYANGTAGTAKYVTPTIVSTSGPTSGMVITNPNLGMWVANTPANTEAFGLTYQQKHFAVGIFDKRVGPMWNDLSLASTASVAVANQVIPIDPFSTTNFYVNYIVHNGTRFDQTKFRLSINNLFNHRGIIGDQQVYNTTSTYTPLPADQLTLLPGRSIAVTMTLGFSLRKQ